jgi:hypothetical protein
MSKARLRPGQAVRCLCIDCMGGSRGHVAECLSIHCLLDPHRMGRGRVTLKLMRTCCLHCQGWPVKNGRLDPDYKDGGQAWARDQALNCADRDCPLWHYRPGTRPFAGRGRGKEASPTPSSVLFSEQEASESS